MRKKGMRKEYFRSYRNHSKRIDVENQRHIYHLAYGDHAAPKHHMLLK